jgi:ABC-type enterobactin transport system permease subunit
VARGVYVSDVTEMTCAYHYIGSVTASMIVQMAWMKSTAPHRKVWIVKIGEVASVINLVPHLEHISTHVSNLD